MDSTEAIRQLYSNLLNKWNRRDACGMASLIAENGNVVGFDGSMTNGQAELEASLKPIFDDHPTGTYVSKIREVRLLSPTVGILRAVAGMVQPGQLELNASLNAVQTLVAEQQDGEWRIALFQNTPAAFHGRPHLENELIDELREVLRSEVAAELGDASQDEGERAAPSPASPATPAEVPAETR